MHSTLRFLVTTFIALMFPFGVSAQVVPPPAGTMGFLGCSMTLNAVDGYYTQGGTKLWPTQSTIYGGGSIGAWANSLTNQSKWWGAFNTTLTARPTTVFWFELCTSLNQTPTLDTYAGATTVLTELRRRVPNATVYVSAQPSYTNGHVCGIAGATGPATAQSIVDQLVANGLALRGPVMGPLASTQTVDGCHATAEGKAIMGNQLVAAFDVVSTPTPDTTAPTTPTSLAATPTSTTQINLSWTASTDAVGVTGYRIYRNGTQITTTTGTTYSNTGLTAATTYTYTVQAYDAAGNSSAQTAGVSATTQSTTPVSTKFTLNQRIQTTATLNIRSTANGTLLGSQTTGILGTITGGPTYTGGYHWWNVNFDSGVDGWAVEN